MEICNAAGIQYAYLPLYSADLNPIEEAFAELKTWCKDHNNLTEAMSFEAFLDHALQSVPKGAAGHFSRARMGLPIREGSEEDYWDD